MPNKYKPLTLAEKQAIIARHKALVDKMNETLPQGMKVEVDPDLDKRLDDPGEVGLYRIAEEMEEKRAAQRQIHAALEAKYGKTEVRPDPLSRTIYLEFDTSGTDEAERYNERIYRDYLLDPNKIVFMRYGKALETDPSAIYACGDDKLKLAEYYRDTYPLCEEGFVFNSVLNTQGAANPELKSALRVVTKPMETIGYPVDMVRAAAGQDYFACPKLNPAQAALLKSNAELMNEGGGILGRTVDLTLVEEGVETPKSFFGKFVERNIPLQQGMFVKLKPESYEVGPDGKPTNPQPITFDAFFAPNAGQNVRMGERKGNELFHVSSINRSFETEYLEAWRKKFNIRMGRAGQEFDIAALEDQHKGGIMERYILFSTSKQYKEFLQAFKDYNDPKSPNYLNKEHLKTKGQAYLDRKKSQGYQKIEDMKGTSKDRALFVTAAIEACDETSEDSVAKEWLKAYAPEIKREPFLHQKEVEDLAPQNGNNEAQNDLENIVELDDDLNMTV